MDVSDAGPWAVVLMVVIKTLIDAIKWWKESSGKSAIEKDQAAIRADIDSCKDHLLAIEGALPPGFLVTVTELQGTLTGISERLDGVNSKLEKRRDAVIKMLQERNQHLETEFREKTGVLYERQLEQAETAITMAGTAAAALDKNNQFLARIEPRLL